MRPGNQGGVDRWNRAVGEEKDIKEYQMMGFILLLLHVTELAPQEGGI